MLTTRALMPSAFSFSYADTHRATSLPVADEDDVGLAAVGVGQDVGALGHAGRGGVLGAVEGRHGLAGEDEADGVVLELHDDAPRFGDFVGVAGADDDQAGDGAEGGQVLDRLVGRAVLADADGVVGEDVDDGDFHDGREADGGRPKSLKTKKPEPNGRTLDRAMPLRAAPMANSRTPKWKLRPA